MIFIFDLDGTFANDTWRKRCLPDYEEYHSGILSDEPNAGVAALVDFGLTSKDASVAILTSRPERYRYDTELWLQQHGYEVDDFLFVRMRKDGERGSSPQVKAAALAEMLEPGGHLSEELIRREVLPDDAKIHILLFDDRDDVVEAYRAAGFNAIKV